MQRAASTFSSWLGLTGGSLLPKYANTSSRRMREAQRAFLALNNINSSNTHKNALRNCTHDTIAFDDLCKFMGRAWVGCAATGVVGEPLKEWLISHVDYPCATTKQQLAVYYMGISIAQSMRQANCMVLGQQCHHTGELVAAMIVCEHEQPPQNSAAIVSNVTSSWQDEWWELGVTMQLASLDVPDYLLRSLKYQEQQSLSALKGIAVANMKQAYHEKVSKTSSAAVSALTKHNNETKASWRLEMVAIDPSLQGQGYGKEFISILCDLADAAVVPCDLESASQRNTQFYRSAGFDIQKTLTIPDPTTDGGGIPLHLSLMRRWPASVLPFERLSFCSNVNGRRFYSSSCSIGHSVATSTRSSSNTTNATTTHDSQTNNDIVQIVELSAANVNDLQHPKHFVTILDERLPGGWKREPYVNHHNAPSIKDNGHTDQDRTNFTTTAFLRDFAYHSVLKHFLPAQYPDSVATGYASYAKYSFAASVAGSAAMVLSTQTLLLAVGVVGSSSAAGAPGHASILAGALNWVLKDGVGQLGGVLYASFLGRTRRFDANPKRWRMMAALCLDLGTLLEILSPYAVSTNQSAGVTNWVLPLACVANVLKNMGFLTAGASRAALHQAMCLKANLGDVTAKAGSQATAAGLGGTSLGIGISTFLSSSGSVETYVAAFCLLSVLHQVGNYLSVQSVPLTHFNNQRLHILLEDYCNTITEVKEKPLPPDNVQVLTPQQVATQESFLPWDTDTHTGSPWLVIGAELSALASTDGGGTDLRRLFQVLSGQEYLVNRDQDGTVYVIFSTAAKGEEMLKGIFHAHVLNHFGTVSSIENRMDSVVESLKVVEHYMPFLVKDLESKGWRLGSESFIVEPTEATRYSVEP